MGTIWFVPMQDDTRTFTTPEGPITINRTEVESVWQDEGSEWCVVSYAGRIRTVRGSSEELLAWVRDL